MNFRRIPQYSAVVAFAFLLAFGVFRYVLPFELPSEPYSTVLLDRNGNEIGEILSEKNVRHRPLEYSDVPEFTKRAVVALEDRRFFSHFGLDPVGIARAFYRNFRYGGIREGASTLDTGLVRNALWIEDDRTWSKKILEAIYALRLDGRYSKEKILAEYLNRVSF